MKQQPYSAYKPSGVEWLGDIPEHWDVKRGRFAMRINPPSETLRLLKIEEEVSFVPMESVGVYGGISLDQSRVLADISGGYTEFQDGDVIVAKITPCFENGKGAHVKGLLNGVAYGTTELHVLRAANDLNGRFLFYISISETFRKLGEAEMYGAGGQKRVPPEFNKNFRLCLPPIPEQQAIAAFLDHETGRIDTLVAKKESLIELLREKRSALISHAVTKGLDPSVKLKPSGVEWLGEVSAHWEVKKLKYVSDTSTGFAFSSDDYTDEGIPLIRIGDILQNGNVDIENAKKLPVEYLRLYRFEIVEKDDILMAMTGATIGKAGQYQFEEPGLLNQRVCKFIPISIVDNYLWYILKSEQYLGTI